MVILLSFTLIAARLFQVEGPSLLDEPWNSLLFLLIIPAVIQLYKIWQSKGGKKPSKLFLQIMSFVVSGIFVCLSGGFAGLIWPVLPVMGDNDFFGFLVSLSTYVREFTMVVGLAFGAMMALYEGLLKRLFEIIGFASAEKVASRKTVGFWA